MSVISMVEGFTSSFLPWRNVTTGNGIYCADSLKEKLQIYTRGNQMEDV
jgi:hypothetical protein